MLDTFLATVSPMMVMFICILIGFLLHKYHILPENTPSVLSKLGLYVLLPARIVTSFFTTTMTSILSQYQVVLYGCAAVVVSFLLCNVLAGFFCREGYERKIYRYSLFSANFGYLGNAIVPSILGEAAMASYILFSLPLSAMVYTWGIQSLTPDGKKKTCIWKQLLQPPLIAMVLGVGLGLSGLGSKLPTFVSDALGGLAGCMGPVAMILTGFVIGSYSIGHLLKNVRVYIVSLLRLVVLPGIIAAVLWLLGADKQTMILSLFSYGTALGLNTVVIPAAYDGDTDTGASMAMISHVASILTIPLMYALLSAIL